MPGKIFVNYRRDDSAAHALTVAQYLEREFGASNVFLDIDRMRAGQKFPKVLEERLLVSKVMLAIIGPSWLTVKSEDGQRRLDDPEDWVRLEISRALARGVPVIPVLVGGASLPRKSDLPDDLKPLVDHHVATITTNGFRNEMSGLARDVRDLLGGRPSWPYAAAAAGVVVLAGVLTIYAGLIPVSGPALLSGSEPSAVGAAEAKRKNGERIAMLEAEEARTPAESAAKRKAKDATPQTLRPGETFRDCPDVCPEMVVVPAGTFRMGSPDSDAERSSNEGPTTRVTIAEPFAVGKFETTFDEWDACVTAGGCENGPVEKKGGDGTWGKDRRPVINVDWNDAKAYAAWLSKKSGKRYRLLTEAEWEYAARAGTATRYAFGDTITNQQAQFSERGFGSAKQTVAVGSFQPNAFGLHDMHGNVWEWVEDCYADSYKGTPADGSAATSNDCSSRVLRGGSWYVVSWSLRSSARYTYAPVNRDDSLGFRVGRTLTP